jgi:hypothetical protein
MTAPSPRRPLAGILTSPSAGAAASYTVIALILTWPLAAGLARDIPSDLGDSVLACWILPVYALSGNIVLSYNLLFLSTFVLSGLGTFLLVRELTGSARAGFVAGLLYAFAPYRIGQFSHLQVLSSQWMPFALCGFRRYFATRRAWPLAGATAALVLQNWSCGYFLLSFTPFAAAYVLYEIADRGLWRDVRVWASLGVAASVVAGATVPLLMPYLELRRLGFAARPIDEVVRYSADVYSYLTAHQAQSWWGTVARAFPRPEGELFPSLIPMLLALAGIPAHARITWAVARATHTPSCARTCTPPAVARG